MATDLKSFKRPTLRDAARKLLHETKLPEEIAEACLQHPTPEKIAEIQSWGGFAEYVIDKLDNLSGTPKVEGAPISGGDDAILNLATHVMNLKKALEQLDRNGSLHRPGITAIRENLPYGKGAYARAAIALDSVAGWEKSLIEKPMPTDDPDIISKAPLKNGHKEGFTPQEVPELDPIHWPNEFKAVLAEEIPHLHAMAAGLKYFQDQFSKEVGEVLKKQREAASVSNKPF